MSLAPGTQLGPYQILALLGKGGMGEVWRARDTKLGREVAIKSLPAEFALDRERRARFEQEARALATLNHSNVGAIYGLEERDGAAYLVLELIEGATLADEIANGPLPLERALAVGAKIAEGLEAAHEAGIVHRDLKPANIKVGRGGSLEPTSVKILDFGLARNLDRAAPRGDSDHTLTAVGRTMPGMIVGTVAYMSPEQARGEAVDRRTDIFAFGCVLYECLTARQVFGGPTMTDALAATVKSDPDWALLPANVPAPVRELLRRCLEKNPRQRLQSIGDARVILQERTSAQREPTGEVSRSPAPSARRAWTSGLVAAGVLAALGVGVVVGRLLPRGDVTPPSPQAVRAVLALPPDLSPSLGVNPTLAFSPDGRTLVFRASQGGVPRFYRRALDSSDAQPIAGTEGGFDPFFSPDGQWIGFFAQSRLKKISVAGGAPVVLADVAPVAVGGVWMRDDTIVFSPGPNRGLMRVAAAGGAVEEWSRLDTARGEHAHAWPQALSDGRVLVTVVFGKDFQDLENARAVIVAPGEKPRDLMEGSAYARIAGPWLVFVRGTDVLAAPLDRQRLAVTGPAVPVTEPILMSPIRRNPFFAVSATGTLVFASGSPVTLPPAEVVRVDRAGRSTPMPLEPGYYSQAALSPDGKRLALVRQVGMAMRLFAFDVDRRVLSPVTPEPGRFFSPVWSPDGGRLAFSYFAEGEPHIRIKSVDGSDTARPLTQPSNDAEFPNSWSPDGRVLAYTVAYTEDRSESRKSGTSDIWVTTIDGSAPPRPWFETPFNEIAATFAPDGRFMAYVSNESGRSEIYVRPFPGPGGRVQVSNQGGTEPAWSSKGQEILYREGERFMSAAFRSAGEGAAAAPRLLFAGPFDRQSREDVPRTYDVSRDGSFIVALQSRRREPVVNQLSIVTGWTEGLRKAK